VTGGRRAAVDVGTNSVRLLVVEPDGAPVTRDMTVTRLGKDVDRTGRLDDRALTRTLETLGGYRKTWEELGVDRVRIAATSAVRDARDRDRFFDGVRRMTGADAEVLTGEDEARTAFRGATAALDVERPTTVLDVGGGSTELIVGDGGGRLAASVSLQLGCVRLTERLLASDPPGRDELPAARAEIDRQLDLAADRLGDADPSNSPALVGIAGTVTTLAALHLGLDAYEPDRIHGTALPREAVRSLTDLLAGMPAAERAGLGPMAPGREDVILGGALIVEQVLARFGFAEIVASEADLLDGLVGAG
jgi:exopolyphosphatase/guanosine-5'-triphosphate,3'-diphosphate pyrophosphatase